MVGQPEQPVHFPWRDEATVTQVGERVLHFEELRPSHREVTAELAVSESTEAFCNQRQAPNAPPLESDRGI